MLNTTLKAEVKSFSKPEEIRNFPKGKVELLKIGGALIGRGTFEPGWKWSTSVQPIANEELRGTAFPISSLRSHGSADGRWHEAHLPSRRR